MVDYSRLIHSFPKTGLKKIYIKGNDSPDNYHIYRIYNYMVEGRLGEALLILEMISDSVIRRNYIIDSVLKLAAK